MHILVQRESKKDFLTATKLLVYLVNKVEISHLKKTYLYISYQYIIISYRYNH